MKKYIVELTSEERPALKDIIKAERMAAHKRRHGRVLLKADQGPEGPAWKDADIANAFDKSVERLRRRPGGRDGCSAYLWFKSFVPSSRRARKHKSHSRTQVCRALQ